MLQFLIDNWHVMASAAFGGAFSVGMAYGMLRSHIEVLKEQDKVLFERLGNIEKLLMRRGVEQ